MSFHLCHVNRGLIHDPCGAERAEGTASSSGQWPWSTRALIQCLLGTCKWGMSQGILHILYCPLDYHLAKIIERVFENSRKLEVLWRAKPEKEAIVFFVILLKYSVWIRAQEIWLWFLGVWVIPEATRYNGIWDIWLGPLGLDYFQILSLLQSWTPGGQAKVSRKGGARTIRTCPDGLGQEPKVWPIRQLQNCSDRRVIIVIKFEK